MKKLYGNTTSLFCSALSGALFLTPAEHMMLYQHNNKSLAQTLNLLSGFKLFRGFIPTVFRESMFILNVLYIGPHLAKIFNQNKDENPDMVLTFLGRISSGVATTLISQPFDCIARELQMRGLKGKSVDALDCLKSMHREYKKQNQPLWKHPLMKGSLPRIVLASYGGAIAGGLFEMFDKQSEQMFMM